MKAESVRIETPEGVAPCRFYHPEQAGAWPAAIWYMDGMGIRPSLLGMAQRLASEGYCVLVPDLYYRGGDYPPFDPATLQDDPAEQARIMELVRMVTAGGIEGHQATEAHRQPPRFQQGAHRYRLTAAGQSPRGR